MPYFISLFISFQVFMCTYHAIWPIYIYFSYRHEYITWLTKQFTYYSISKSLSVQLNNSQQCNILKFKTKYWTFQLFYQKNVQFSHLCAKCILMAFFVKKKLKKFNAGMTGQYNLCCRFLTVGFTWFSFAYLPGFWSGTCPGPWPGHCPGPWPGLVIACLWQGHWLWLQWLDTQRIIIPEHATDFNENC